ncbi:MAG: hypothetical protein HUU35_02960 [Armatimonadetes bacterium]|nr:hypothetical protein [Armatimonadota bacterium]
MAVRLLTALLLTLDLASAAVYRFDMGSETTPLAAGYALVTPTTLLADHPAYGWTARARVVVDRNDPANPWFAQPDSLEYALYSDGVLSIEQNEFVFTVEPGRYAVTAVIGDLALDEQRPGNSIWANGVLVAKDLETNATVKAVRFPVEAADGRITLRFRADSPQKYATVMAVTAEPLAGDATLETSITTHPETPPGAETFRLNWEAYVARYVADWEQAKAGLRADGIDLTRWAQRLAPLRQRADWREVYFWGLGNWERLQSRAPGIGLEKLCAVWAELGADGFVVNSASAIKALHAAGLKHALGGPGEHMPGGLEGVPLNEMKDAAGQTGTVPGVWSNVAPESSARLREHVNKTVGHLTEGAAFLVIDEPRGQFYAGRMGDYSPAAQVAFKAWCMAQGEHLLAARGIPERGRAMEFYRWYQYRLMTPALLVKEFTRDLPAGLAVMPGNGNVGPEQMNHSNYWPPAVARLGMWSTSWSYDEPGAAKIHAETVRIAAEHGGRHAIVPPLYAEAHTAVQDRPTQTACISALTERVCPWHFTGPLNGPNRVEWMKTAALGAWLAHATTGMEHTPPLHVWCPESIVYNDLVEFNATEAQHWTATWRALFAANLDYAVTNTIAIPADAVLLYSCVRPVLNDEEYARLQRFVQGGGRLLVTFEGTPERPDGTPHEDWAALRARASVVSLEQVAEALGERPRNLATGQAGVVSYLYRRDGRPVHLVNNTSLTDPATLKLPVAMTNGVDGAACAANSALILRPGGFALLEER